ncbi:MAG TPA: cell wall-binding repeat-containing protein [Egibacteraceae bacterium]|nr:cell wall-binding repeat-containing protein [Egibacteraceae bacterium]
MAVLALAPAAVTIPDAGADHGAQVYGTVTAPDGTAVGSVRVGTEAGPTDTSTETSSAGGYRLHPLAPGSYAIEFGSPLAQYETATVTVSLAQMESKLLDVALQPAALPLSVVSGATRIMTAVQASQAGFPQGADTVVIAAGGTFPDALAAAPLAAQNDAPLLLVGDRSGPEVLAEVGRLGAGKAFIVGASGAVSVVVQSELERAGVEVERIAGENRFDTAALIAREVGAPPSGEVAVAFGGNFPDALAMAPVAAANGIPIVLADTDLPKDTAAALAALGATRTLVLGGQAVVSDAVVRQLPAPRRISGPERYATGVAVAEEGLRRGGSLSTVYVATGGNFPDALAAGPFAALTASPVLLVDGSDARAAGVAYQFLVDHFAEIDRIVVLGGDGAVSSPVRSRVRRPAMALE